MAGEYGLFIGNYNNIQIDSRYRNLPIYYQGQASGLTGDSKWIPLISYEPENWQYGIEPPHKHRGWVHYPGLLDVADVIAFKPGYSWYSTSRIGHGIIQDYIGQKYEPYLLSEGPYNKSVAPDTVDYIVYSREAYNSASGSYGMVLRNANNEISFHSSLNYLKIREVKSFIPTSLYSVNLDSDYLVDFYSQVITHTTENPYYILPYIGMQIDFSIKVTPDMDYWCNASAVIGLKKVSATSCRVSFFIYRMANYAHLRRSSVYPYVISDPMYIAICTL